VSDLGSDVASQSVSASIRVIAAIAAIFKKIFELWENRHLRGDQKAQRKLHEAQAESAEMKLKRSKAERMVGYVAHETLVEAGVPLTYTGLTLTETEFGELVSHCKREDILITAIVDTRAGEERKLYVVECKEKDLVRLKELVDIMNDEKRIDYLDQAIADIEGKSELTEQDLADIENLKAQKEEALDRFDQAIADIESKSGLTEQDLADIENLKAQKEELQRGYTNSFNDEQAQNIAKSVSFQEPKLVTGFDEAFNRITGKKLVKDVRFVVADAADPGKHIRCHAFEDVYKGKPYIKTKYEAFNGSALVFSGHDGRFDGRPFGYWDALKAEIQAKSGLGEALLKFHTAEDYEGFVSEFKERQPDIEAVQDGDYQAATEELEKDLEGLGITIEEDVPIDKGSGKVISFEDAKDTPEMLRAAQASLLARQMENYRDLKKLESEVACAHTQVLLTAENTPEYISAKSEYDKLQKKHFAAVALDKGFSTERTLLHSALAEKDARTAAIDFAGRRGARPHGENGPIRLSSKQWGESIEDRRASSPLGVGRDALRDRGPKLAAVER